MYCMQWDEAQYYTNLVKLCNREKIQYGKCSTYGHITVGLNTRYTMSLIKTYDTFRWRMRDKDF